MRGWSHPRCLTRPSSVGPPHRGDCSRRERSRDGAAANGNAAAWRRDCSLSWRRLQLTQPPISIPAPGMTVAWYQRPCSGDNQACSPEVLLLLLLLTSGAALQGTQAWERQLSEVDQTLRHWRQLLLMPLSVGRAAHREAALWWKNISDSRVHSPAQQLVLALRLLSGWTLL